MFWQDNALFALKRLKSKFFEIFSSGGFPKGTRNEEIFSKNVDFNLRGNCATTQTHISQLDEVIGNGFGVIGTNS